MVLPAEWIRERLLLTSGPINGTLTSFPSGPTRLRGNNGCTGRVIFGRQWSLSPLAKFMLTIWSADDAEQRVRSAFSNNYERLVEIKNKYDPKNLFRVNHNIKPTV